MTNRLRLGPACMQLGRAALNLMKYAWLGVVLCLVYCAPDRFAPVFAAPQDYLPAFVSQTLVLALFVATISGFLWLQLCEFHFWLSRPKVGSTCSGKGEHPCDNTPPKDFP